MITETMRTTFRHFLVLVFLTLFVLFGVHYSMAQEGTETSGGDQTENPITETTETEGEVLGEEIQTEETVGTEPSVEPTQEPVQTETPAPQPEPEPEPTPEPIQEPAPIPEPEPEIVEEEVYEEPLIPFVIPQNLPKLRAIPEVKEFYTDPDAPHACWVRDFVVDMKLDPTKNNVIYINNPTIGPSTMEVVGLPPGFEILFGNKAKSIAVTSGTKELPFTITKKGKVQKGSFNVVFVFTKKSGGDSSTTCQMNLVS